MDFKQVDKMAMDLGIEENNDKRIKSAIKYALIRITYNGHCCTLQENLIEYVKALLGISLENIENSYINLIASGDIIEEERENGDIWVYLSNFYQTEKSIAEKIRNLDNSKNLKYISSSNFPISKSLCRVLASSPVVSVILFAALPVGAQRTAFFPLL